MNLPVVAFLTQSPFIPNRPAPFERPKIDLFIGRLRHMARQRVLIIMITNV